MAFKIPSIPTLHRRQIVDFPTFNYDEVHDRQEVGRGSFGSILVGRHDDHGEVVIKRMFQQDDQHVKSFIKEARITRAAAHENVARVIAICETPFSLLMEYEYFTFLPLSGKDERVSNLREFLNHLERLNVVKELSFFLPKISKDIFSAIAFLHSNDIAHRDLKPSNILISNKHYADMHDREAQGRVMETSPIICKVADFGESRSKEIQTEALLRSRTQRINRGTIPYMAPEAIDVDIAMSSATIEDLKRMDMWAVGMIMFNICNPNVQYPYEKELKERGIMSPTEFLSQTYKNGTLPCGSEEYARLHSTTLYGTERAFHSCAVFKPDHRPSAAAVLSVLLEENIAQAEENYPIGVSQMSAIENFHQRARVLHEKDAPSQAGRVDVQSDVGMQPLNDASNACTLLSLLIGKGVADLIIASDANFAWSHLLPFITDIIMESPLEFNKFREYRDYDTLEALQLLKDNGMLPSDWGLSEAIVSVNEVFSKKGRTDLVRSISELKTDSCNRVMKLAVYTCEPYSFLVGAFSEELFVVDTHVIPPSLGGDGSGLLKIFRNEERSPQSLCKWIWKRLDYGSTKDDACQSMSVIDGSSLSTPRLIKTDQTSREIGKDSEESNGPNPKTDTKRPHNPAPVGSGIPTFYPDTKFSESDDVTPERQQGYDTTPTSRKIPTFDEDPVFVESDDVSHVEREGNDQATGSKIPTFYEESISVESDDVSHMGLEGDDQATSSKIPTFDEESISVESDGDGLEGDNLATSSEIPTFDQEYTFVESDGVGHVKQEGEDPAPSSKMPTFDEESIFVESDELWNNKSTIPVYEKGRPERYTWQEAVEILVNGNVTRKCTEAPLRVRENASFIIDLSCFENWEDIKAEMNGVYDAVLRCGVSTVRYKDGDMKLLARRKLPIRSRSNFHLIQNCKRNKANQSLERAIFILKDESNKIVNNMCIIQYIAHNSDGRLRLEVTHHGNANTYMAKPFYPTKKSVLTAVKKSLSEKNPTAAYDDIRQNMGGVCSAPNPAELPRGRRQLYSLKSRTNKMGDDDVGNLLRYARDKEDLIWYHSDFPEDVWVLGTCAMASDLSRYTTCELLSEPFSVDPTFSLGKFEITPIVYKNLSLTSIRTGEHPVFLGPTMIHHSKNYDTYKLLSNTVASKCNGLSNVKGFVTDGEKALQKAFQDVFQSAESLRCFRHFEQNCNQKLKTIGITKRKHRSFFTNEIFGTGNRSEGLLDARDGGDLRKRLDSLKVMMDDKETEILQKQGTKYKPKFWEYLNEHYQMMSKHMISEVRLKAGLRVCENGNPAKCYTNTSESINHVMKSERDTFLKSNPGATQMSKLQFTQHVFEKIHNRQKEEFCSAFAGVSDEYALSEHAQHLGIVPDVWFDWPSSGRREYVDKVYKLSMKDIFSGKDVEWPTMTYKEPKEFVQPEIELANVLVNDFGYSMENASALENEVKGLSNHPHAIQRKATMETKAANKFEVASSSAKQQSVVVTLHEDHVTCGCGRFRHDYLCKHSLAVATSNKILSKHIKYLQKKGTSRKTTPLAEHEVNKQTAGKKGARNKFPFRKERYAHAGQSDERNTEVQPDIFSEIHHNNNSFVLEFLHEGPKLCKSCSVEFCHRKRVVPFDVILTHKERWFYPVDGDWSNKRASTKEAIRFYHPTKTCILQRFPYFTVDYVEIPPEVMSALRESHKIYLSSELGLTFDK